MPALWLGGLLGLVNDQERARRTGQLRSLNRRRITLGWLRAALADPTSSTARAFAAITRLVRLRRGHEAFAPGSPQTVLPTPEGLVGIVRGRPGRRAAVLVSVSPRPTSTTAVPPGRWVDALAGTPVAGGAALELPPYGTAWLVEQP